MGPESSNNLPSRPRFSWDIRTVPWTDGRGNQEQYAEAVSLWEAFQDTLADSNSNKVAKAARGIMLQSQLYGRARDLCKAIPDSTIRSDQGAEAIVQALYKRDPLAVVSDVFQDFLTLMNTKRNHTESFKNFESRFQAQVSRLNAHGSEAKLSESLVAFALLANADVDNNQRVSVLANAAPRGSTLSSHATTNDYLEAVSYEAIASVLRQCDKMKLGNGDSSSRALSSNAAHNASHSGSQQRRPTSQGNGPRRTPEQLARLKARTKCHKCRKWGHWRYDHKEDGSLKPGVKAFDAPPQQENSEENVLRFNMATLAAKNKNTISVSNQTGPLLDDGAPYSGIGSTELKLIAELVCPEWNGNLDPIPDSVADRPYWQYGSGEHRSAAKRILGSVLMEARTDQGTNVQIRHLVIDGSSQWVVGRNVTSHCDILHANQNKLILPPDANGNSQGSITLVDRDMHTYIPHQVFTFRTSGITGDNESTLFCASAHIEGDVAKKPWTDVKKIVDKVHKHVCGHSTYSDIRVLLERNKLWNEQVEKYLQSVLERCTACLTTAKPKSSRKVSLSAMTRSFNDLVCVDHLFLDQYCVMHAMDAASRYSVGAVVEDTSMWRAILLFDAHWVTPFWTPQVVAFDRGFNNSVFVEYLQAQDIGTRPLPPRRHSKNVLESKHRIIRDVFLRLQEAAKNDKHKWTDKLLVQQAIRISNDLYGSDILSAQELAKGYARPVQAGSVPKLLSQDLIDAYQKLLAKRKLTLILRSKTFEEA